MFCFSSQVSAVCLSLCPLCCSHQHLFQLGLIQPLCFLLSWHLLFIYNLLLLLSKTLVFAQSFGHLWHHQRPLLLPKIQAHFHLCVLTLHCPKLFSSSFFCCCFISNQVPFPKCSLFSFSTSFLNSHFFCLQAGCALLWFFSPFLPMNI